MIRIMNVCQTEKSEIFARTSALSDAGSVVSEILSQVRDRGDAALRTYCERFDGACPETLEIPPSALCAALSVWSSETFDATPRPASSRARFRSVCACA